MFLSIITIMTDSFLIIIIFVKLATLLLARWKVSKRLKAKYFNFYTTSCPAHILLSSSHYLFPHCTHLPLKFRSWLFLVLVCTPTFQVLQKQLSVHLEVGEVEDVDQNAPAGRCLRKHVGMVGDTKADHKHQQDEEEEHEVRQLKHSKTR